MATFKSDLVVKGIRHRSSHEGVLDSVTGRFRLNAGASVGTSDTFLAVPLGENVRPLRIILSLKEVSGTPALSGGAFSVGVAPITPGVNLKRPDGVEFPPLTASATQFSSSADFDDGSATEIVIEPVPVPSANTKWGPYYVTLTPTETSTVSGGAYDLNVTVEFAAEKEEADPVYTEWLVNGGKYKN